MGRNASRRAGFTLVELLVVSAIVGTLAALLLPSLNTARDKSRAAACVNNLRQLGQAGYVYHDDYNALPCAYNSGYFIWNGASYVLYGQMLPVTGKNLARCYYCPSATTFRPDDPNTGLANLGVTNSMTVGNYYVRGYDNKAPRTLAGPTVSLIADIYFAYGSARNHPTGANVLFSDGSAHFVPLPATWDIEHIGAWDDLDRRGL